VISESLAICEYVAELYPELKLWPQSAIPRAQARGLCCEVLSGITLLKLKLPFIGDGRRKTLNASPSVDLMTEVTHLFERIKAVREAPHSPGIFGVLDAMLAPMMMRIDAYGIEVPVDLRNYVNYIMSNEAIQDWIFEARTENERIKAIEDIHACFPDIAHVEHKL
jgi:glutathione S-transferase